LLVSEYVVEWGGVAADGAGADVWEVDDDTSAAIHRDIHV
jgi:hypothetical protein